MITGIYLVAALFFVLDIFLIKALMRYLREELNDGRVEGWWRDYDKRFPSDRRTS